MTAFVPIPPAGPGDPMTKQTQQLIICFCGVMANQAPGAWQDWSLGQIEGKWSICITEPSGRYFRATGADINLVLDAIMNQLDAVSDSAAARSLVNAFGGEG